MSEATLSCSGRHRGLPLPFGCRQRWRALPSLTGGAGGGSLTEKYIVSCQQERDGDNDEEGDVSEAGTRQGEEMTDEWRGVDDEQP